MISRAIGFEKGFELSEGNFFETFEIMLPKLMKYDVMVQNIAISINPVDTKLRQTGKGTKAPHILGFDSVGIVTQVGDQVPHLVAGDRVIFAGTTNRYGSYSEKQIVDSRIVAKLPENIPAEKAAALPLTFLTAYELLFEKMDLVSKENGNDATLLIINGAGGVGSIMIQLAKWAGLTVLATASRPETADWCEKLGADQILNHHKDLTKQVKKLGYDALPYIAVLHSSDHYYDEMADLLSPFGYLGSTVATAKDHNLAKLKAKSGSFVWEYMFAKTDYDYHIKSQGEALTLLTHLLSTEKIQSTLTETLDGLSPETFYHAHQIVEADKMIGKLVIRY
ncbi:MULTISPECIES: zinc-binding alcohol dehydrogenase family protein [Enterococcus]|uniref:Zinc-type alcohol dehydrogenase-like protein n=1 Tax=Candidatus Enterococcus ferrettii TaxID=2815324 RepID=A0ABV0EQC7_9ENTE|nr:zinc-binding alcohol dehydrogenase family protein [Enterococcus sp. 665A]MBO1340973.1 zinc-binding alcohol dehydrogenase family protein [Enterococcus sp. 665A]